MTEKEAKTVIKEHLDKAIATYTRELVEAIHVAVDVLGPDASIDDVYKWAQD